MRLNKFIANATSLSRREADEAIEAGRVELDGSKATIGDKYYEGASVFLDKKLLESREFLYVLLNKPIGYVSSRRQQGDSPTLYELLPKKYQHLNPAGRLDADSRGLILMTNDGDYANQLTHPSSQKTKRYIVQLDSKLTKEHVEQLNSGVELEDGTSKLSVSLTDDGYEVVMHEGRNRQIRRTFDALGYAVTDLNRVEFGPYTIDDLGEKVYSPSDKKPLD